MKIISKKCIIPIIGNCAISSSGDYEKFNIVRKKNSVDIPHMYEKARQLKGQVPGEHGIGLVKQPYLEESLPTTNLAIMRGVKKVFAPNNIFCAPWFPITLQKQPRSYQEIYRADFNARDFHIWGAKIYLQTMKLVWSTKQCWGNVPCWRYLRPRYFANDCLSCRNCINYSLALKEKLRRLKGIFIPR